MLEALFLLCLAAGDDKAADEAIERFKKDSRNPSAAARAAAVAELARTPHEKTLKQIVPFLTQDEIPVRIAAAKGLGGFTDYRLKVVPILVAALGAPNAKEWDVQVAIYEALGKLGDEQALPALYRAFEEKQSKVVMAALAATGDLRKPASVEPILELMKRLEKHVQTGNGRSNGGGGRAGVPYAGGDDPNRRLAQEVLPACLKALQAITTEKWSTSQEWMIWWNKHRAEFAHPKKG